MPVNTKQLTRLTCWLTACLILATAGGCSLFVMAGKSILGDPVVNSPFSRASNVDLRTGQHRVVIVASTPETIKVEFPAATVNLIEKVSRKLKSEGVNVVNYNKIATWLDDNGGYWNEVDELANAFETDFIIHLEIDSIRLKQPGSPDMFEGRVSGTVYGYEVHQSGNSKVAHRIFNHSFERKYPDGYPQLADRMSREEFHRKLMEHVSLALAHQLYDHHSSEEIY